MPVQSPKRVATSLRSKVRRRRNLSIVAFGGCVDVAQVEASLLQANSDPTALHARLTHSSPHWFEGFKLDSFSDQEAGASTSDAVRAGKTGHLPVGRRPMFRSF
eukprot:jgi/Bigna1/141548/aug1.63_g16256